MHATKPEFNESRFWKKHATAQKSKNQNNFNSSSRRIFMQNQRLLICFNWNWWKHCSSSSRCSFLTTETRTSRLAEEFKRQTEWDLYTNIIKVFSWQGGQIFACILFSSSSSANDLTKWNKDNFCGVRVVLEGAQWNKTLSIFCKKFRDCCAH